MLKFSVGSFTIKVDLHLRWLATENFKITKQRKFAVYQVKMSSKRKENTKLKGIDICISHNRYK